MPQSPRPRSCRREGKNVTPGAGLPLSRPAQDPFRYRYFAAHLPFKCRSVTNHEPLLGGQKREAGKKSTQILMAGVFPKGALRWAFPLVAIPTGSRVETTGNNGKQIDAKPAFARSSGFFVFFPPKTQNPSFWANLIHTCPYACGHGERKGNRRGTITVRCGRFVPDAFPFCSL